MNAQLILARQQQLLSVGWQLGTTAGSPMTKPHKTIPHLFWRTYQPYDDVVLVDQYGREQSELSPIPWDEQHRIAIRYYLYHLMPDRRLVRVEDSGKHVSRGTYEDACEAAKPYSFDYPVTVDSNPNLHQTRDGKPIEDE